MVIIYLTENESQMVEQVRQAGADIEITEEMIEAGKRELLHAGFGGEYDNPCVDFEEVAVRLYRAMASAVRASVRPQKARLQADK
jgi:hypothetical protein